MPSNETAKTKSAPRRSVGWALLALVLATVTVIALWQGMRQQIPVRIGDRTYMLTRAVSQAQKEKGLSDTPRLDKDSGMLFGNDEVSNMCFWMHRMHYPLDIIWIGQDKKVVHIEENIAPNTYPKTFCAYGQYVIELNAGEIAKNGLKPGASVAF